MKTILTISRLAGRGTRIESVMGREWRMVGAPNLAEAGAHLADAHVIIFQDAPLSADILGQAARCILAVHAGAGTGGADIEAARDLGIMVSSEPDACTDDFAGLTLDLIEEFKSLNADSFPMHRPPRIGLVGMGEVGRAVAKRLRTAGWDVRAFDPFTPDSHFVFSEVMPVPLSDLFGTCDVISLHRPMDYSGKPAIGPDTLPLFRHGAILINTSDPGLVDSEVVLAAVREGTLSAAVLTGRDELPTHLHEFSARLQDKGVLRWISTDFEHEPGGGVAALALATETSMRALQGGLPGHLLIDPPLPRLLAGANGIG